MERKKKGHQEQWALMPALSPSKDPSGKKKKKMYKVPLENMYWKDLQTRGTKVCQTLAVHEIVRYLSEQNKLPKAVKNHIILY